MTPSAIVGKPGDHDEFAGIDPLRVIGLGEKLLGLRRVIGHRLGRP